LVATNHQPEVLPSYFAARKKNPSIVSLKLKLPDYKDLEISMVFFLTPKGQRPFFGLFLEFGQPIVDAIFVQEISNFW
jgi:hypothetical protein